SSLICSYRIFFFFFQAEDGIRDRNVTGVQTCALPILKLVIGETVIEPIKTNLDFQFFLLSHQKVIANDYDIKFIYEENIIDTERSEERRVGKECRSRSWTYEYRKKE